MYKLNIEMEVTDAKTAEEILQNIYETFHIKKEYPRNLNIETSELSQTFTIFNDIQDNY